MQPRTSRIGLIMLGSSARRAGRCTLGIESLKVAKRDETTKSLVYLQPVHLFAKTVEYGEQQEE